MDRFLVVTNEMKDPGKKLAGNIVDYLAGKGAIASVATCEKDCNNAYRLKGYDDNFECVIVLGGDGTILQVARDVVTKNVPILGVNLGTVGYLAEVNTEDVESALDRVLSGDYDIQDRMMLKGRIIGEDGVSHDLSSALNDIAVTRSGSLQVISFSIYVNGEFLCDFSADGILVATPTGSTGYNMSAGGPIVEPSASLLLLTPICAQNVTPGSVVLSDTDEVEIVINKGRGGGSISVQVSSDGSDSHVMNTGDRIIVSKASHNSSFIRLHRDSFVQKLHRKMSR